MNDLSIPCPHRTSGRPPSLSPPLFPVPFCANPNCRYFHHPPPASPLWCVHHGFYDTRAHGTVPRARCLRCGKTFSAQTFQVSYYMKQHVDLVRMLLELIGGASVRAISRAHGCSVGSIANRIDRLCRQAIAMHLSLLARIRLREPLVADGFVDFTVSQYFPDVLTMVSGKRTQMLYAICHAVVPRRGRMTDTQRRRARQLSLQYRPPPRGEREGMVRALFDTLSVIDTAGKPVELYTDEHTEYPQAVELVRKALASVGHAQLIRHHRVNSRIAHAAATPLFSANYLDRQLRLSLAAHRRQTICYGRNVAANLARTVLYMVWHNYNKPYRIVGRAEQPPPHGVKAGVEVASIGRWWQVFFRQRVVFMKVQPEGYLREIWLKGMQTPLKRGMEYLPKYAFA